MELDAEPGQLAMLGRHHEPVLGPGRELEVRGQVVPEHDERKLFELLTLEGAQAGLSWLTILRKRDGYRRAFAGFDPQVAGDIYSNAVNRVIFDAPYKYEPLARPLKLVPNTAVALPEISADGKTWTIRIQPGIYFADDPANAEDPVLALVPVERRPTLIAKKRADGALEWNVVMQGRHETVFFDF